MWSAMLITWLAISRSSAKLADVAANARRGENAGAISPIALEAVKRIDALFEIERGINGVGAAERLNIRKEQSARLLEALASSGVACRARPRSPSSPALIVEPSVLPSWLS
jgi:transposase